jgi:hypothetical protein
MIVFVVSEIVCSVLVMGSVLWSRCAVVSGENRLVSVWYLGVWEKVWSV